MCVLFIVGEPSIRAYTRRTHARDSAPPPTVLQRMGRNAGNGPLGDFDLDESPDAPPVSEQIVTALMANAGKVLDLFRSWDEDGDGTVTRTEFHHAMKLLGLEVPSESIDEIFTGWDQDGGGEISLRELTQILNAAATTTKNMQHLRKTLGKKKLKIVAMFKHGDVNGDNELDKLEFKSFLKRLGIMLPKDQLTWLFEKLDRDKSGKITFRELDKALKLDEEKERAARKAEEEEERRALLDPPVEPVDLNALRQDVLTKFKGYGFEGKTAYRTGADAFAAAAEAAVEAKATADAMKARGGKSGDKKRLKGFKLKPHERDRMHMRLRLRGTGLEAASGDQQEAPVSTNGRAVTRHGRPAVLPPVQQKNAIPPLIDQLSRHRLNKATPSKRHFNLLPHVTVPKPSWLHVDPLPAPASMFQLAVAYQDPADILRAELEAMRAENAMLREELAHNRMIRSQSQPW